MVDGMTSGFTVINHIFVKILFIIDKFIPLAVTVNKKFIALLFVHISAAKYELFMWYICHLE